MTMKTELTIEQSQRLIELGVNPYLASSKVVEKHPITENELQYPIFTIADLLSILPKKIEAEIQNVRRIVQLEVRWYDRLRDCWLVRYSDLHGDIVDDKTPAKLAHELIDALYSLAVWLIENNLLQQ